MAGLLKILALAGAAALMALPAAALPKWSRPGTVIFYQDNNGGTVTNTQNTILAPFDSGVGRYHTGDGNPTPYLIACLSCFVPGNSISLKEYTPLWPLAVGRSVQFIRTRNANNGQFRYAHTVRVAGTERVTTNVGWYDTWVFDETVEQIGGPYRAQRRVWFSERLGWTVKLTFSANDGTPNYSRMMTGLQQAPN
jgi:hypothetical protein